MHKNKIITYRHVDVFADGPLTGNSLTVFLNSEDFSTAAMQKITQEMRHYESIFLTATDQPKRVKARIFTMKEELDFAGHPLLGAACVLHEQIKDRESECEWLFELNKKEVTLTTTTKGSSYIATMNQGQPHFEKPLEMREGQKFLMAFNLSIGDIPAALPLQVVSTGLPYLIIPVKCDLQKVRIVRHDLGEMLYKIGADFAYIINVEKMEGRTWDNEGRLEDSATGSAAGPVGAYLVRHRRAQLDTEIVLHQGRFVSRPSQILIKMSGDVENITSVKVKGEVYMVARGIFDPFEIGY